MPLNAPIGAATVASHWLDGHTRLIAHLGHPTGTFKAPLIYNPWFASIGLNAAVVPMGVRAGDFEAALPLVLAMSNVDGALITMPHKIAALAMMDEASPAARIAGSCNAVRRGADGRLLGDMFDGEGFVRGLERRGRRIAGAAALVIGAGGVGSAIAASLAGRGLGRLGLDDPDRPRLDGLCARLAAHHPALNIAAGAHDPRGYDIVVNATPLGMQESDPLPFDIARVDPSAIVGEVVLSRAMTPLLAAAAARGCAVQTGLDMLFEQIPAYLAFFCLPVATPETLRALALTGD